MNYGVALLILMNGAKNRCLHVLHLLYVYLLSSWVFFYNWIIYVIYDLECYRTKKKNNFTGCSLEQTPSVGEAG